MKIYMLFSGFSLILWAVAYVWFLIECFKTHIRWGICFIFFPMVIFFCLKPFWVKARIPLGITILGIASYAVAIALQP